MLKKPVLAILLVSLVGAHLIANASAQTSGSPTSQNVLPTVAEQIEVVATRVPETPHDVPASVEVIGGDALRAMGATTIREALSLAVGVDVGPGGDAGPASAVPEFWGLREFDAFLLVVDDIPWGRAFNPAIATLNLRDVDRIEVLRGSAPVTYGATSFVGVIHVVHQPAALDRSYLSFRGGSFKSGRAAIDLAVLSTGSWKSRVGVDVDRQGFKDARTMFTRGHASYRGADVATDRRQWLTADLNWLTQDPASPHVREGAALSTETPLDANYNPANAFLNEARISAAWGVERPTLGNARWSLTGSYSHSGQRIFRGFLTNASNVGNNATGFRENIDVNDIYADTHITWPRGSRLQVVAGGDVLFGNGEGRGATFTYTAPIAATSAPLVTEPTILSLDAESRRQFFGGYLSAEWIPTERLHVSTGVRINATVERRGEGASATHVRPAGSVGAIVGVWQQGVNHVKVFGNVRDTFKLAVFDFSLAENEGVLRPETARSYEGGVKVRAADGHIDIEASSFRMDFKNLVTSTVVAGLPALQNAGSTRFQGFEIATEIRGAHNVSGRLTYSLHDGKFVDFVQAFGDTNTQLAGKRFEMSARHLFSGGIVVAPAAGLGGDLVVKYVGDRFLNKRNTALAPSFTTIDTGVGYRFGRYEFRVDGHNLTDTRDAVSESELGDAQYYRMSARRVDVTFGVSF